MVDKIIQGKRKKGRHIVPDRDVIVQDELAKITMMPFETCPVDLCKSNDYVEKFSYQIYQTGYTIYVCSVCCR